MVAPAPITSTLPHYPLKQCRPFRLQPLQITSIGRKQFVSHFISFTIRLSAPRHGMQLASGWDSFYTICAWVKSEKMYI
jgi:hypothetical protein